MPAPTTPPENIVLIGFMGCGKSTVGRELHQRLGYPLVDMDQVIEQRAGKSITNIFADDGEAVFRDMETALLKELNDPAAPRRIISGASKGLWMKRAGSLANSGHQVRM